jgi:hypothetical protein
MGWDSSIHHTCDIECWVAQDFISMLEILHRKSGSEQVSLLCTFSW